MPISLTKDDAGKAVLGVLLALLVFLSTCLYTEVKGAAKSEDLKDTQEDVIELRLYQETQSRDIQWIRDALVRIEDNTKGGD